MRLLEELADGSLSPANVMVFGDSATDISLFELFPHSVFITNPKLTIQQAQGPKKIADDPTPEPTFSHKYVAETIAYFGGWKIMWREFSLAKQHVARNRFIMAYKDISNKT